ncbi:MAG: sodium-translocating pyrophosphatase [Opitutales bacterium]|nr:sodium-translocating pyrophosphatase [Opitutales bacterium]
MNETSFIFVPIAGLLALFFAFAFFKSMMRASEGSERMQIIAGHVRSGAMAYLRQQYRVVGVFFAVILVLFCILSYGFGLQNPWVPFAFISAGFGSALAGYFGMKTATYASARVAQAASESLDLGLRLAFRSGAVMGLVVVGLAMLDISFWFFVLNRFVDSAVPGQKLMIITTTLLTFGMGASLQALFARVGGGIFTKAADVGADLVGKVESGIPEDDPRNPATIADNVGDNVGDIAGMGADLYESYYGSILATAALGAAAFMTFGESVQYMAVIAPMLIAALGIVLSILGIFTVRTHSGASQRELMAALNRAVYLSSGMIVLGSGILLWGMGLPNWGGVWVAIVTGLAVGLVIGRSTEIYTSAEYRPTRAISAAGQTGPATVIIAGMGVGFTSTVVPVLAVALGVLVAYAAAAGGMQFNSASLSMGLYGIGIAAVGMLSTLGLTLATDAYGPIADNAGGNAEMSGLGPEVRRRTDALDALGNTTAATGKGFAIGSAALTALALLASYVETLKIRLIDWVERGHAFVFPDGSAVESVEAVGELDLLLLMERFQVSLMNPKLLAGLFIGSMMAFLFCGLTMNAVGRAAQSMVEEVRRQFREISGILTGEAEPDYARCVEISTKGAQKEMVLPASIAVIVPIAVGLIIGVPGVFGLMAGALSTGFVLAVFMANSGGAWDNAKKHVEEGHFGGKGSQAHNATVIGDTVGDPFKDTSGPSLNILIKLMSMVSIVTAGLNIAFTAF